MTCMAPSTFIHTLGDNLVRCTVDCEGVAHNVSAGVLPRCMVFEDRLDDALGCVVVGLNPGRCPQSEREFYLKRGCTYHSELEFWEQTSSHIKYNTLMRKFLAAAGLAGDVLWTELAKCECGADEPTIPPVQTLRRCAGLYLSQELGAMPEEWPVIAVGSDAFRAVAFLEPNRRVLGIPHPTGSRGHFARLFEGDVLRSDVSTAVSGALDSDEPVARWLAAR